jgi:hypothetical protein
MLRSRPAKIGKAKKDLFTFDLKLFSLSKYLLQGEKKKKVPQSAPKSYCNFV